jgi:hypothetical protein
MINEEILEILKEFNIPRDDGICYLISLYYGYTPSYIPGDLKVKLNMTGIYRVVNNDIDWKVGLFKGQETAFEWVRGYCDMFKESNPSRGGKVRETTARLKKLFAKNPDIRKDEVIGATKMYLLNSDSTYIRFPHYFVEKGEGASKTSDLLDWIDKYRLKLEQEVGRNAISNTMQ